MSNSRNDILQVRQRVEDSASIVLTGEPNGNEFLEFTASSPYDFRAQLLDNVDDHNKKKTHLLAEYVTNTRLIKTYPIITKAYSVYLFEKKHDIRVVSFEDQLPLSKQLDEDLPRPFAGLPAGFVRDPFDGLGLVYPLRFIFDAFDELEGIEEVVVCKDKDLSREGDKIRLPLDLFNKVRKAINRAHQAALSFASEDKSAYLRAELLSPLVGTDLVSATYRKDVSELRSDLAEALNRPGRRPSNTANAQAAVRTVRRAAKDLASHAPAELFELNRQIEMISLEELVDKFQKKIDENHNENHWQKFLTSNSFIIRLAFGVPITIFGEQVSVGGGKFRNSGGKLADYVVRSGLLGNVSLIEIKKPSTALVESREYRGEVFAPTRELSGSVSQILDQRFRLQQEINQKKINSRIMDVFAYHVHCVVIVGRVPDDEPKRKSFEIFRSNLRDVLIITFDELLAKLKAIHEFLAERSDGDTIAPALLGDDDSESDHAAQNFDDYLEEDFDIDLEAQ